jgi:hypothetical protein
VYATSRELSQIARFPGEAVRAGRRREGDLEEPSLTVLPTPDANGVWSVTLRPLEPEIYSYGFNVDGMTVNDQPTSYVKPSSSYTSQARVFELRKYNTGPRLTENSRPVQVGPGGDSFKKWNDTDRVLDDLRK